MGYRNEKFYIPTLFFADDGVLLAQSTGDMEEMMDCLIEGAREIGLEVNREKCNMMVYNLDNRPNQIAGVGVVDELKYLGVHIENINDTFKFHKTKKTHLAQRMANMTFSVISKSCNKILIGKTFWKSVVLPSILFADAVIVWNKDELGKLQREENNVWRQILGAPEYAPVAALRGDIGASTMVGRDVKTKLKYVRSKMNGNCELMRRIIEDMWMKDKGRWIRVLKEYMSKIGMVSLENLSQITEQELNNRVEKWETETWLEELDNKSTLTMYKEFKRNIRQENFYDNTYKSCLLFRARANSLKLGWRKRFEDGDVICKCCNEGEETLEHFLIECAALEQIRIKHEMVGVGPAEILMFAGSRDAEEGKEYIEEMWKKREEIVKHRDVTNA